jgi:predicted alpha-1,2-mannosidase
MRTALSVLAALAIAACSSNSSTPAPDLTQDDSTATRPEAAPVSPLYVGTGGFAYGFGSAFAGAAWPHGMVKAGPDTSGPWGTVNFLHYSGYWYGDDTILGFSHMHLHGTGATDYGILGIMPTDTWDSSRTTSDGYKSKFDKSAEKPAPGLYTVTLATGIKVEIAASAHGAQHRYTYPPSATAAHVIVDLDHHLSGSIKDAALDVDPASRSIRGSFRSVGNMSGGFGGEMIYFFLRSKQSFGSNLVWSEGNAPAAGSHAAGTKVGAELEFDLTQSHAPIELQVGLSFVSVEAARKNLDAELPAFSFDGASAAVADAWKKETQVITFQGGTPAQHAMLDAALYHTHLMPTVVSDADGTYVGLDGKVAKADFRYCSDMSLWDTYRTLHPLYDLASPDRARDSVKSLVAMAKASGYFPRWPIGTGEAGTMIGASAEVVLADAYLKGIKDFDAEGAYQLMRAAAMGAAEPKGGRGGREHVADYMHLGYVPVSDGAAVSLTLEYGQDDVALGQLAQALGHADDATALTQRAQGYKMLFDPESGFLWGKNADGTWTVTRGGDATSETAEFTEANAWQSVWGPWFDFDGFAQMLGGNDKLVMKLEDFFVRSKADYDAVNWSAPLSSGGLRKYYRGENEADLQAIYLFAMAGRPELTQKWLRWSEHQIYGAGVDGIPGNDDGGTMSSWLIFGALGFYPIPGTDKYVVGAPMFPHAEIHLASGTFTIDAPQVSDANLYVQAVELNGAPLTRAMLHHADLHAGGSLVFHMGPTPSAWGHGDRP